MAIRISCPECAKELQFREQPPEGKKVKCSGCSHVFVPADEEEEKPKAPAKKSKDAAPPPKKSRGEDSGDDAPRKLRRDEDEDDDEDDEEEAPSKKKKKKKKASASNVLYWVYRGVSIVVLGALLVVLVWVLLNRDRRAALNVERVIEVSPLESRSIEIDAIPKTQDVKVSATATSGQFNIYVFLFKDKSEVMQQVEMGKTSAKILDSKLKVTEATLSAQVPANEEAVIMVRSDNKKAEVTVKITN